MRNWRLRRGITALALALLALPAVPGTALAEPTYPFRDPHLPVNARVDDLLGRLTLDEKISCCTSTSRPSRGWASACSRPAPRRCTAWPGPPTSTTTARWSRLTAPSSRRRWAWRAPGTPT